MPLRLLSLALSSTLLLAGLSCDPGPKPGNSSTAPANRPPQKSTLDHGPTQTSQATPKPGAASSAGYTIVTRYPHDCQAFTQGLEIHEGVLYESTGRNGLSTLRRTVPDTGVVEKSVPVPAEFFAEGLTVMKDRIYQLTWQNQKGFVYDRTTLRKLSEFSYTGEGWGLANDGHSLIMSDGVTNRLRFLNPETFQPERTVNVNDEHGQPLLNLNELEYIKGEIYANVWQTDRIARIDPTSGHLLGWLDLSGLAANNGNTKASCPTPDVLNGIAYDEARDRLLVTGKLWPYIYEIRVK